MIVVTGASGRTGKRVAEVLLTRGERVRVIGRDAGRLAPLVNLGAEAAVGSVEDVPRLSTFFDGAEAVYLVLPEDLSKQDLRAHQERISNCYVAAIRNAHVEFVVNLSSIGGQHSKGTGPIVGLHNQEQKLNRIEDLNVLHLRAAYFMENLFASLNSLIETRTLTGGMRGDIPIPWIATKDIGAYAAKRLQAGDFAGSSIQELHGQRDVSMSEAASIIGKAINCPGVAYLQLSNSVLAENLLGMGMPARTVELILEMWEGANAGLIRAQEQRSARNTTPTSLESFVSEVFAPAVQAASP
ncbi:MAG TPA: NmrA family NAD(P)-binding protein [Terriglobales bacterium]|nr:NmrA family NAD(P)-binding protein [Terriglobales bacterium]